MASHFATDTVGKALCESDTWLDIEAINLRFRRILSEPFKEKEGDFYLFPKGKQKPVAEEWRYKPMATLFQVRHTIVHNVGVVTKSDANRLRLLTRRDVVSPAVLSPTRDDVRYTKRFLDETAEKANERIGDELAKVLTKLHSDNASLFVPKEKADTVSQGFGIPVTVAKVQGIVAVV